MTIIRNVIFIFLLILIFSCNNKKSELSKSNANVDKKMIVIDTIITSYNIYEASKQALNVFDSVINTVEKCGYNYNDIAFILTVYDDISHRKVVIENIQIKEFNNYLVKRLFYLRNYKFIIYGNKQIDFLTKTNKTESYSYYKVDLDNYYKYYLDKEKEPKDILIESSSEEYLSWVYRIEKDKFKRIKFDSCR